MIRSDPKLRLFWEKLLSEKSLQEGKKLSWSEVAQATGLSTSFLSQVVNGKANPSFVTLQKLAKYFGVSVDYVLKAHIEGVPIAETNLEYRKPPPPEAEEDIIYVPLLGTIPAGLPDMREARVEEYVPLSKIETGARDGCYLLKVHGDSMEGLGILDGMNILVDPNLIPENGHIVVARINGEVTCKRFVVGRNGQKWLMPANHKYPPIPVDETTEIIGVVRWAGKRFV